VHAHSIAGFLSAWVVAYLAVAAFCLSSRRGRRERNEFFVFGMLALALAVHTSGAAVLHVTKAGAVARIALAFSDAGRALAAACLVHVVVQLAQLRLGTRVLGLVYGASAAVGLASAVDVLGRRGSIMEAPVEVLGLRVYEIATPPRIAAAAVSLVCLGASVFALAMLVRPSLRARTEMLPSLWGAAALCVATAFDAYAGITRHGAPLASPYGNAAFVTGVVISLLARYGKLRRGLEERAAELKQRSAELSRSYEELRAAQAELVRKEQLAAVGELSAVIAHEVRNPLAIITTAVATLRREGLGEDDRQTLLGILDEESSRLNRLVGDLLRYAKPVRCERQLVSPKEIVERALGLTQTHEAVKVTLVDLAPSERIHADPQLLRQVFDNLVSNAIQAMPQGGSLTVTIAPHIESGLRGVEVRIADTGEGMDTSVRDRALDPFFTTRAAGTGLGLAIVARIVDAHGGRLRIFSDVGAGTDVHVFLPQQGEAQATRRPTPSVPEVSRSSSLPPMPAELRRAIAGKKD